MGEFNIGLSLLLFFLLRSYRFCLDVKMPKMTSRCFSSPRPSRPAAPEGGTLLHRACGSTCPGQSWGLAAGGRPASLLRFSLTSRLSLLSVFIVQGRSFCNFRASAKLT